MNICVLATAAREGGALSIVNQFLDALEGNIGEDHYYIFTDPTITLRPMTNVTYIPCDTHRFNRVRFDAYGFRRIVDARHIHPDVILSFQNTAVSYSCPKQIVYFHQLFAVQDKKWSFFKAEERKFFCYSELYPKYVKHYLRHATDVVVQAEFIKEMFARKYDFDKERIHVVRPNTDIRQTGDIKPYPFTDAAYHLVFPVRAYIYKRFDILAEAMAKLGRNDIRIHLTFHPEEMPSLAQRIRELHVEHLFQFHGQVDFQTVKSMYKAATALVFPSETETIGLPLMEAATMGLPVIVNDLPYAHDAIGSYEGVTFIPDNAPERWAEAINDICCEEKSHIVYPAFHVESSSSWPRLIDLIKN